jgi:L-lactate dehydrogenase complex protein LldF
MSGIEAPGSRSLSFRGRAAAALNDELLQRALALAKPGFVNKRRLAIEAVPDFQAMRRQAAGIKQRALAELDVLLERYEAEVRRRGGEVHWARDAAEARAVALAICRRAGARRVLKGKSMVSEEMGLNDALEAEGLEVVETDLGEYIIQLAGEPPSHIIAPAVHKTRQQIADLFRRHHAALDAARSLEAVPEIVDEARAILRQAFLSAEVGITGANFLIAETGSNIIVTNEGNGDLSCTLPRVHIVTASIEKVVPTLEDATALLRVLGRSATGQAMTSYTTFSTGPRRPGDLDGPEEYHVILMDNGRSDMLAGEFRDMLRCIHCGACLNHCPVYGAVGGHAYGWVYPGPMGAVLTPLLKGLEDSFDLPNACTLNGRCAEVCPVQIPLTDLLRRLRARGYEARLMAPRQRLGLRAWAFLARRPRLYAWASGAGGRLLAVLAGRRGRFYHLPLAGGWTAGRDLPAPARRGFQSAWRQRGRR